MARLTPRRQRRDEELARATGGPVGSHPAVAPGLPVTSRRAFLERVGGGLGGVALAALLADTAPPARATDAGSARALRHRIPLAPRPAHHAPRARSVIQIFCPGGLSHVDTWDHKPELERRAGRPFDPSGALRFFASKPGVCQPSYWKFRPRGECGRYISDLFPKLGEHVDDIAFVHSMVSKSALHGPACYFMNTGFTLPGFPAMGAWVTYGLGSESDDLPAFVVLPDPRGLPPGGPINWGAGFLPAVHQATRVRAHASGEPIAGLFPPAGPEAVGTPSERDTRRLIARLDRAHADARPGNDELEARIAAYELTGRLQLTAPEATDIAAESEATKRRYRVEHPDLGPFGRQCLLARRLVERGVRFVQLYCGAENTVAKKIRPNWDSHEDLPRDHGYWGPILDNGAAALLGDLKERGLLGETLVITTSEFGRQPGAQGGKGRDHNPGTFTAWLAGGGIRGGAAWGRSDDLGFRVAENPAYSWDLNATALWLLGLDHTRLTYYHNGIERRLTDVHGEVLHEIIA